MPCWLGRAVGLAAAAAALRGRKAGVESILFCNNTLEDTPQQAHGTHVGNKRRKAHTQHKLATQTSKQAPTLAY